MAVVLDNTQGVSLGMAMVQHSMDNLVKQRMQMNELYHDANKAVAVATMNSTSELMQEFVRKGMPPPEELQKKYDEGANHLNKSRMMTASHNKTVQESSPEFHQYYDISSWDANRKRNTVDTGPSALSKLGNAIGGVASKASSWVGGLMGGNSAQPSGATTLPPNQQSSTPSTTPSVSANAPVLPQDMVQAGLNNTPANYGAVFNVDDLMKDMTVSNALNKTVPQNGVR